jgi:hypothetical protein
MILDNLLGLFLVLDFSLCSMDFPGYGIGGGKLRKVVARKRHYCYFCKGDINEGDICVQSQMKPYSKFFHTYCTPYCRKPNSRISQTVKDLEKKQKHPC